MSIDLVTIRPATGRTAKSWCSRVAAAMAVCVAALLVSAAAASAQQVRGRVLDDATQRPLPDAQVTLFNASNERVATALTNERGEFIIRARRAGQHLLKVEHIGYALNISPRFDLTPSEILEIEFRLRVEGILLAPLTVVGRRGIEQGREAFARRLALGTGVHFDPVQVALLQPQRPSDVFRYVEGLRVNPRGDGEFSIQSLRGWGCLAIFLDHSPDPIMFTSSASNTMVLAGVTGQRGALGDEGAGSLRGQRGSATVAAYADAIQLDRLDPKKVRGIEVYRNYREVPRELRESYRMHAIWPADHMGGCGVAIVWTNVGW
jgi:hypothetical protein